MLLSSWRNRNVHFLYAILYFLSPSPFPSSSLFQTKHTCLFHCSLYGRYFIWLDILLALFKTRESTKHSIHYASAAVNIFGGMILISALKWLGSFFICGFCLFILIFSKHFICSVFFLFCFYWDDILLLSYFRAHHFACKFKGLFPLTATAFHLATKNLICRFITHSLCMRFFCSLCHQL